MVWKVVICLLCIEIAKGKMTGKEIAAAYAEMVKEDHASEVNDLIKKIGPYEEFFEAVLDIAIERQQDDD